LDEIRLLISEQCAYNCFYWRSWLPFGVRSQQYWNIDALMAESCLKVLETAELYGIISCVQVEVVSSTLKEGITSDSLDRAPCGMVFRDIHRLLADHFVN